MLEIKGFGGLSLCYRGEDITERLPAKANALLIFLACHAGRLQAKEKLLTYLWEDSDQQAARYNLRHTLWIVKKLLADEEQEILHIAKDFCGIADPANVNTDFGEFAALYDTLPEDDVAGLERLKALYRGDFLDGVYLKRCLEFNDWIFFQRESYQQKYFDVLHRLKDSYARRGDLPQKIELLAEMIQINPLKEELYVEQIKSYILQGDWERARTRLMCCTDMLRNELNESPGEELVELGQKIKQRRRAEPILVPRRVEITLQCFSGPEYLLPSLLAEKLLEELSVRQKNEKEASLADLAWLTASWQPRLMPASPPPDIRIYSSLFQLLKVLGAEATVALRIEGQKELDRKSQEFLAYLQHKGKEIPALRLGVQ